MSALHIPLVAIAVTVALTACQPSGTTPSDDATAGAEPTASAAPTDSEALDAALSHIAAAAQNTVDEGTVHFDVTVTTEGTAGDDGAQPITAQGDEDFVEELRLVEFTGATGELQVVVDSTDVYVELPGTEEETWARVELDALIDPEVGFGGPGGVPFQSAAENLRVLTSAVASASEAGTEELDGEPTTRYDLTVDPTAVAAAAGENAGALAAAAEESGLDELDMQVWVDGADRIRRISYALDLSQADVEADVDAEVGETGTEVTAAPTGAVTVTVDYSNFGEDVTIDIPSDENVIDLDEDEIRDTFRP